MESLFLIGSIQALFMAIILFYNGGKSLPNSILTLWMVVLGLNLMGVYLGSIGFYRDHPEYFGIDAALPLLHGPLIYFYVRLSIQKLPQWKSVYLTHLIPYVFFTAHTLYLVHRSGVTDRYLYLKEALTNPGPITLAFEVSIHLLILVYLFFAYRNLTMFQKTLPDNYSYTEGINMKWLQAIISAFLVISVIIVGSIITSDFLQLFSLDFKAVLFYGALSLLPFYLVFVSIRQYFVYPSDDKNYNSPSDSKYADSNLSNEGSRELFEKLESLMTQEQPYLDGKLSISRLASLMEVHPKELSQVINENHSSTFFSYVNGHRVEEFKRRLRDERYNHLSLLGIALDCGFNTKSAFNNVFKKITGITPSQYQSKLSQ